MTLRSQKIMRLLYLLNNEHRAEWFKIHGENVGLNHKKPS